MSNQNIGQLQLDAYQASCQMTQDFWNEYCERKRLHREMTAEDLGLTPRNPLNGTRLWDNSDD